MAEKATTKKQAPVYIWYVLSALFGVIGSLLAWLLLRKQAAIKAQQCLIIGLSTTIIASVAIFVVPLVIGTPSPNQPRYTINQVLSIAKQSSPECIAASSG
jgi:hypothetical protein